MPLSRSYTLFHSTLHLVHVSFFTPLIFISYMVFKHLWVCECWLDSNAWELMLEMGIKWVYRATGNKNAGSLGIFMGTDINRGAVQGVVSPDVPNCGGKHGVGHLTGCLPGSTWRVSFWFCLGTCRGWESGSAHWWHAELSVVLYYS